MAGVIGAGGASLGEFGIYTFDFEMLPPAEIGVWAQELEQQGWPAVWFPEVGGREAFSLATYLLGATTQLRVVNAIARIADRSASATFAAGALLAEAYPGRHLLGLGYGSQRPGVKPLEAMTDYLSELDGLKAANRSVPRISWILAAYGPRMAMLARDRSAGVHTYHVTAAHTARTREILGPNRFLGVQHAVLFESDPTAAYAAGRKYLRPFLKSSYSVANFRRLGYSDDELARGGSDRMVDELVAWGDPRTIRKRLRAHLDAGADHVAVQIIGVPRGNSALVHCGRLADVLPD
jgi:probable F420-dependent oxidoreductase